jgi:hypothetical protein
MVQSFYLFSQEQLPVKDTNLVRTDTISADTTGLRLISAGSLDKQVTYSAEGSKKNDLVNKTATLISKAEVTYGTTQINADSIVFNMASNTVFAAGIADTAGKVQGTPVFKEGSQEYKCDSLRYNFLTKKAIAYNIVTKQDEGLLRSSITKLLDDGSSNISRSTYSTCDAEHPHFYISLAKAKVYPGKKIISGPGYLVLEDIPLPVALPFGFFPVQTKRAASGILIPKIGQEQLRGYNLTDGGYYFAINDYIDLALKGSIYTNGTWILTAESNYNRKYKYNGLFSFSYANNISGHKGLSDYSKVTNYKINWNYNQNVKAHPGSRFSANVNMSSSGYDKTNSYNVTEHVTTQRQSSVSYSKTWDGTPFNLSASMNHSQNVSTKHVSVNLPKMIFTMNRIYPLKSRNNPGQTKWWKELQFQYSASLNNQVNTDDSILFTNKVWKKLQSGFQHQAPLSLQIRPFRNFSISPSVTYTGVVFTQKIERFWDPNYYDELQNKVVPSVITDTLRGVFYGQAINPSISASYSPQVFGVYSFKPESKIQAIRHVIKPSVGFSYTPAFSSLSSKMWRTYQSDTLGHFRSYSIYEGNLFQTPSLAKRSAALTFNLTNLLEAKVFDRNDTTGKPKKVKLIDNFNISTSYSLFADSMKWNPVVMALRTTIFNNIGINGTGNFSLYGIDPKTGRPIGKFAFAQNGKLMRLTNFQMSVDFDLGQLLKGDKNKQGSSTSRQQTPAGQMPRGPGEENPQGPTPGAVQKTALTDEYGYSIFDVPWSMRVSYTFVYSKPAFKPTVTQNLSVSGNVSLTKKMAITYMSGFDFKAKEITMTQIGITRDLHCWEMSFNWVPNGTLKMWNFTIRVKAPVLRDLKYERRKDFHDKYY